MSPVNPGAPVLPGLFLALAVAIFTALGVEAKNGAGFWSGLLLSQHEQLHPPFVHFPIAFITLECVLVLVALAFRNAHLVKVSRQLLLLGLITALPAILFGLHDAGDGPGFWHKVAVGAADRFKHLGDTHDSLGLHVIYIQLSMALAFGRALWRQFGKTKLLGGWRKIVFAALTLLNLWLLLAAAQQGGEMMGS